ncbi:MAG: PilN domain-containing protein [Betaproteobacteria bacterium]|nr:PilN domain-containing protein [Betaproteobacteria bacterium]MDH3436807.1 PilN domain-containing protein [Betaproteobacteria bacterium]
MTQNINLLAAAFRKQDVAPTLATVAQCLGIALLLVLGLHFFLAHRTSGLGEALRVSERSLKEQRAILEELKGQLAARKLGTGIEAEIAGLERELKETREAMIALKGGVFGDREGFAEYLRAFSRQSLNGLWLTGFTITGGGDLEIRGRVLSPDLVPSYIQRLNKEAVLQGRSFARFEMSRPQPQAGAAGKPGATQITPAPRFLEFSLATMETASLERSR